MRLASLLLLWGCPKPDPLPPEADADADTDTDVDADVDVDVDTDVDADTDTDTDTGSHTSDTGTGLTGDTALFEIRCDSGDTGSLGIPDCNQDCYPAAFVGDGVFCDDGSAQPWGSPDFNCAQFSWDGGDCPQDTGDTGP